MDTAFYSNKKIASELSFFLFKLKWAAFGAAQEEKSVNLEWM